MRWTDKLLLRVRSLFRHGSVEHELNAELSFHLEEQIVENLAAGMSGGVAYVLDEAGVSEATAWDLLGSNPVCWAAHE